MHSSAFKSSLFFHLAIICALWAISVRLNAQQTVTGVKIRPVTPGVPLKAIPLQSAKPAPSSQNNGVSATEISPQENQSEQNNADSKKAATPEQQLTDLLLKAKLNRSTQAILKAWVTENTNPQPAIEGQPTKAPSWKALLQDRFGLKLLIEANAMQEQSELKPGDTIALYNSDQFLCEGTIDGIQDGKLTVSIEDNAEQGTEPSLPDLGSQLIIRRSLNSGGGETEPTPAQLATQFQKMVTVGDWAGVKVFLAELPPSDADRVYTHLLTSLAASKTPELPEGLTPELEKQIAQMMRRSGQPVPTSHLTPTDILSLAEASPRPIEIVASPKTFSTVVADPVSGDWTGSVSAAGEDLQFQLTLRKNGNSVEGKIAVGETGMSGEATEGTWDPASKTLRMTLQPVAESAGAPPLVLEGRISNRELSGTFMTDGVEFNFKATQQRSTAITENQNQQVAKDGIQTETTTTEKTNPTSKRPGNPGTITAIARLIKNSQKAGHDFTAFVNQLAAGTTHFGMEPLQKRLTTADLLMQAAMFDDAEKFLPPAEDPANPAAALKLWSKLAAKKYQENQASHWLDIAWDVNQRILTASDANDSDQLAALSSLVELSPQVDKAVGLAWVQNSFTQDPDLGMKILSNLGSKSATMSEQTAQVEESKRLKLLNLQNKTVEQLIEISPENAKAWQEALSLLAQNWLAEAEISLKYSRQNNRANTMRIDMYGNYYWVDQQQLNQSRGGQARPRPIKLGDLLEIAPGRLWRDHVDDSLQTQLQKVLARLHLRLNEEDLAFPYIERLAQSRRDIARDLVHQFLQIWTSNHDPNTSRRQRNPYIYQYGFDQKADAIPLTRSKQERNLKELTKWVGRIRAMNLDDLDEKLLANAFTTCHSNAEVFKIERVRDVFGDLSQLKPETVAAVCEKMRANLSSNWKNIKQQEAMQTNRKEPEVQEEVLRGYGVARQLAEEALRSAPDNWQLHLALATLLYDENSYAQTVQKSSEFSARRDEAFQKFELAAEKYRAAIPNLEQSKQSTDVYDRWFYASLGAVDLGKITDKTTPDQRQYPKIREAIQQLPGAMAEVHMAKFANNLFTRMSPIKPEIKFRYLRGGFEIVGDHPRAWEAQNLYEYYRDLVNEIQLDVVLDGDDNVGHQQPFGVYVNLLHTPEIERESGGFAKYIQNQNNMPFAFNYGRPTENYREKFSDTVNQALEEHFEILNITFQSPSELKSRPAAKPGWRVTPYAYVLVKSRGPEVDRLPPLKLDMDFLDTSGYVVIPVESAAVVIDASQNEGTPRPVQDLQITQTLDERQADEGKLIVEISATGKGLIPQLEDLIDLEREDFELVSVDDQGVLPTAFEKDSDEIQILSDRSWTVEYQAKQSQGEMASFQFGEPKPPEAIVKFQRYEDADLVGVEQTVTLAKKYGSFSWGFLSWLIPLIAIGIVGGIFATLFLSKPPTEQSSRFHVPNDVNAFSVLTLLNDIKQRNGISAELSQELQSSINRVEESYFGAEDAADTENLAELAQTWVKRAK